MINLYRYPGNNFGDNLSTYLTQKISGQTTVSGTEMIEDEPIYVAIGSVLEWIPPNSIVWGTGYMGEYSRIPERAFTIHAVRGKLTRDLLIEQGFDCLEIYGDPTLLLPRYYTPQSTRKYKLGIVPHYVDYASPLLEEYRQDPEVPIIDVRNPVETVIDEINSCERIISSSLHGLIVADAYGIPSEWVEWSDKVVGSGFKFRDYFSVKGNVDLDKLLEVCPFRKSSR